MWNSSQNASKFSRLHGAVMLPLLLLPLGGDIDDDDVTSLGAANRSAKQTTRWTPKEAMRGVVAQPPGVWLQHGPAKACMLLAVRRVGVHGVDR